MDLPSVNVNSVQTSTQRSAGHLIPLPFPCTPTSTTSCLTRPRVAASAQENRSNALRIQRQKVRIARTRILDSASKVMELYRSNTRSCHCLYLRCHLLEHRFTACTRGLSQLAQGHLGSRILRGGRHRFAAFRCGVTACHSLFAAFRVHWLTACHSGFTAGSLPVTAFACILRDPQNTKPLPAPVRSKD